jgi:hypothetical protein
MLKLTEVGNIWWQVACLGLSKSGLAFLLGVPVISLELDESEELRIDDLTAFKLNLLGVDFDFDFSLHAYCVLTCSEFKFFHHVCCLSDREKFTLFSVLNFYLDACKVLGVLVNRDDFLIAASTVSSLRSLVRGRSDCSDDLPKRSRRRERLRSEVLR